MKISDAYFDGGFGQKIAKLYAGPAPSTAAADSIARGAADLANVIGGIANEEIERQNQAALERSREQEAQLKEEKKLRDMNAAKRKFMEFETVLGAEERKVVDDPNIAPEDYPKFIRSKATELYPKVTEGLSEWQKLHVERSLDEYIHEASERMFDAGRKEIKDQAWADDLAAADALVNNPVKSARDKIAILKDESFFAESGRPAHEIELEREKRVAQVVEVEVDGLFNRQGPVVAKRLLEKKTPEGMYTYLPEMQLDKREAYIAHADEKITQLEAAERRESRERQSLHDQRTHNLFESVKTMLNEGYSLSPGIDVQARTAFKGTKYEGLYGSLKEKTGSLAFKTGLLNKDPLRYFARQNGYDIRPIDVTDTATIPAQMKARIVFSSAAQKALNLPYRPDFFTEEADAIGSQLESLPGANRVQAIKMWTGVLGSQNMTQFAKQVSGVHSQDPTKNTALALEIALTANGKDVAAKWVAVGREYRQNTKMEATASKAQDDAFKALAGSALKNLPAVRDDYRDAVNAAFVYLAKSQGLDVGTEKNFGQDGWFSNGSVAWQLYKKAFESVVGKTVRINNKTTIIPPGLTPDGFRNSVKRITPEIVTAAGGVKGLSPEKAAELLRSEALMWESGEGVYSFQLGGKEVKTNNGKIFRLRFGR